MAAAVYATYPAVWAYLQRPVDEIDTISTAPDNALLTTYCTLASRIWERQTGVTYGVENPGTVTLGPEAVTWAADGTVRARLPVAGLTAVSAAALRTGTPAQAWTALTDLTQVTIPDAADPRGACHVVLYPGYGPCRPAWLQLTYTAGYATPPAEVSDWVIRYAAWLWRHRDAPYEKTANALTGTVTIPVSMPVDLRCIVEQWRRWEIA